MPRSRPRVQQGIQSIEVGNRVLAAMAQASAPAMLKDIARAAHMTASKAHRYLVSYARVGLVAQDAQTGRYDFGPAALQFGLAALRRIDAVAHALPVLRDLAAETGETVALAVWANRGATMVRWMGADAPVAATLRVGSVMPLTRSATGLVFAAWQPERKWIALAREELARNRRYALQPRSIRQLRGALAPIRARGLAATDAFIPGVSGMAAPVFDHDGALAAALVVLGYSAGFKAAGKRVAAALCAHAARLSARLGHAAPTSAESIT